MSALATATVSCTRRVSCDGVAAVGGDGTLVPVPVFDHEAVDRALGGDDLSVKDEVGDELYVAEGLRGRRTDVG